MFVIFLQNSKKHVSKSLFFNNVTGLRRVNLLKKTPAKVFSYMFRESFKNIFFTEHFLTLLFYVNNFQRYTKALGEIRIKQEKKKERC